MNPVSTIARYESRKFDLTACTSTKFIFWSISIQIDSPQEVHLDPTLEGEHMKGISTSWANPGH